MSLLEKMIGKQPTKTKESLQSTELAKINPKTVVVKGTKYFTIFEDGNGDFRAQHVDGRWLYNRNTLFSTKETATKFSTLEYCQDECIKFINGQLLTEVGTIEFIPHR